MLSLAVTLAVCLTAHRSPVIDDGGFFLLLGGAVLGVAWFGGTGAALGSTVIGAAYGSALARTRTPAVDMHLALFVLQGLLLTALVAELRRAYRKAARETHEAEAARLEAEAASRMKDEFLGTISHELRTPLNTVLGWMHLIRNGVLDPGTERRGLEAIERNVRLQAQFTADLLDISKALTGTLRLESRPVSLPAAVNEAVSQVSTAAAAKDIELRVLVPDAPIVVRGDANRLRQVVWHLLANAIKFTPRGGAIEVRVEPGRQASITIADSGPGIDPAFLPRIFDRFTQADPSTTRTVGGFGVGLSLVRELVERHGGEIQACNGDRGQGAVFIVRLPMHAEEPAATPRWSPAAAAVARPLEGVRVLLLERDGDARDVYSVVLEARGASVRVVGSTDEALEILESWRPDVLMSDGASAEHDTYALVGKVQSLEADRGGRIPAFALTRATGMSEPLQRLIADVHRELPKPLEPARLADEIVRMTGRERRRAAR